MSGRLAAGPTAVIVGAVVLAALHHDFWLWDDRRLVLGFLPSGLVYHLVYSLVAATFWGVAMRLAWPRTVMDAPGADADAAAAAGGDDGGAHA